MLNILCDFSGSPSPFSCLLLTAVNMAVDTPPYLMTEKHEEHVTDKDDADDSTTDSLVLNEINDDRTLNMICSINEEPPMFLLVKLTTTAPLTVWPL